MSYPELEAFFKEHAAYYRACDASGMISQYQDASLFWEACGSSLNGVDEIHNWFNILFRNWDLESVEYELVAQRVKDKALLNFKWVNQDKY